MDVPVPVLCDVSCDRAAEIVPSKSFVLVSEVVCLVPAQVLRDIGVQRLGVHELEDLKVIRSDGTSHVIVQNARDGSLAHADTEGRRLVRCLIGHFAETRGCVEAWQVTDAFTQRRGQGLLLRPAEVLTVPAGQKDQSFAVLRDSEIPRVCKLHLRGIASILQFVDHDADNSEIVIEPHVGDVLHEDGTRFESEGHVQEGRPQLASVINCFPSAGSHKAADLATTRSAERLTRGPSDSNRVPSSWRTSPTWGSMTISELSASWSTNWRMLAMPRRCNLQTRGISESRNTAND